MLRRIACVSVVAAAVAGGVAAWAADGGPVAVVTTPDGARLLVSDTRGAAEAASGAAATVDRDGYQRAFALCLQAMAAASEPAGGCEEGRLAGTVSLRAPAPAAQCGYRATGVQRGSGPPVSGSAAGRRG